MRQSTSLACLTSGPPSSNSSMQQQQESAEAMLDAGSDILAGAAGYRFTAV